MCIRDRPTGALDSKSTGDLLDVFDKLNSDGQTILMVTHSVRAASNAGRVLFIKDGEIFHQIYRGAMTKDEMYKKISDTLTVLLAGGEDVYKRQPVISIFTGKIDFSNLFLSFDGKEYDTLAQAQKAGAATLNYGTFITGLLNFIIMAFVVFLLVKAMNKLRTHNEVPQEATTKICPHCKSEIHIDADRCPHCTSKLD